MKEDPAKATQRATRLGERPGLRLRAAHTRDASSMARVFVDCWKEGYHGILPTSFAAGLAYDDQTEVWQRMILMPGNANIVALSPVGDVIAFLSGGPERSGNSAYFAEIYGLYVLPEFRAQGAGRSLLQQFGQELAQIGLRSLIVRVLEANPLRGFYEAMGAAELGSAPVRVAGRSLSEISYGWSDILASGRFEPPGIPPK